MPGTCVGRTPLLPLDVVREIYGALPSETVSRLLKDDVVWAALEYASPALTESIGYGQPVTDASALRAVVAYLARMSTRTTPFGLFAGVGPVDDGETTTLRVVERDRWTSSQFDQGWIDEFVRDGEEQQYTAGDLSLVFHGATLLKGTRLVLLPDDRIEPDTETTVVQSLRATAVVRHLREWLTTPHRVSDIVEHLSQRFAHGDVELRKYLRKLWSAGYLISESATSTNADIAGARLRLATRHPSAGPWIERAQQKLNTLDATELGEPHREVYATLQREGREHSAGSTPIMVDLHAPMSGTLGANVRAEVETLAELSLRNGRRLQCPTLTARFQRCFEGTLRFVPLLEAVDACLDLLSGDVRELQPEPPTSGAARQLLLDSMLAHAFASGSNEVVLSSEDVDAIFPPLDAQSELPETVELGFSIAARSLDDVNNDEFLVLPGAMFANHAVGATAARFHRMFRTRSEHGLHDRADDDCIRAELVYAPRGARELNIASRRVDAAYEIGVGVFPSGRNQLRLDDLWVGIDPRTNDFVLLSKSLSKRVRLVETTALNPRLAAAPVARFLSDVGHAGRVYPAPFAWPDAENAQYRPRFRYGRIVLGLATWNFTKDALERSGLAASAHAAIVPLPKYVALVDRDQRLLIDTTTDVGQDIVREQVKKMISEVVTFEESMLNFPHGWLQGTQGSYHAEFTIGIRPRSPHRGDSKGFRFTGELVGGCARSRDDWLYASVFEPAHRFDFLLRAVFDVAFAFAAERNIACFFVRYNDPESQLRLRFQVEAGSELAAELTRLLRTQQTAHGIRRMSFEQYQPETERYGGDASLRECEKIFAVSSALALAAITTPLRDERVHAGARDFAALVSLLVPNERLADVIEALRPPPGERHLDDKDRGSLRRLRSEWPATLSAAEWKALDLSQIWAVLSRANRPMGEVLAAIIHMHANRLGLSKREERRMKTLLWQFLFGRIQEPHK